MRSAILQTRPPGPAGPEVPLAKGVGVSAIPIAHLLKRIFVPEGAQSILAISMDWPAWLASSLIVLARATSLADAGWGGAFCRVYRKVYIFRIKQI